MVKGFFTKVFGHTPRRKGPQRSPRRHRGLRAEGLEDRRLLAPILSITPPVQYEGNSGETDFFFLVELINDDPGRTENVVINYSTQDITATAPSDYTAISNGQLILAPGTSSGQIVVKVNGDTEYENDEFFQLNYSATGGGVNTQGNAVATILTDPGENAPMVLIDSVTANEGNSGTTNFVFTVTLSEPTQHDVVVNWTTTHGTTDNADLAPQSGTLTITPADVNGKTITIQVNGDTTVEPNEIFFVDVTPVSGADPTPATGVGTIVNDDIDTSLPTVQINNVSQPEGNSGQTPFVFTVSLSFAATRDVTINYSTSNGTAQAGSDYQTTTGSVFILQGQTSEVVSVSVLGDTTEEPNETFFLNITSADGANVLPNTRGTGTILNDDDVTPPAVTARVPAPGSTIAGTSVNIDVTFSEPVQGVDATDLVLGGSAGGTVGTPSDLGGNTWRFPVSGLVAGSLDVTLAPDANDIEDLAGNDLAPLSWGYTVTTDTTPPSVSVDRAPGQNDPTNTTPIVFRITFSEAIQAATFTTDDLTLGGTAGATTAVITPVGTGNTTFDVAVSGMTQSGTVILNVATGAALDLAGNPSLAPTYIDNQVGFDNVAPAVTVNQAPGQADPTNTSPIVFRVTFSEPVSGFTTADLTLGGTAGASTAVITPVGTGNTTFDVSVSGMTQSGTVILNVATGAAVDAAGNPSQAPTIVDNTVQYNRPQLARQFTTGVFTANNTGFHLADVNADAAGQNSFIYGPNLSGWLPVAGDWDGDGDDTVGVYDPFSTTFYLVNENSASPGPVNIFSYGGRHPTWIPIAGDWDGDGVDTIGVFVPESATFYLVNQNSATPGPVIAFSYGSNLSGWKPVAGDWDGDGVDTIGVFDPRTATFYLVNQNSATPGPVIIFSYGSNLSGWWPVAGDWNGDGRDTIGVYDPRGNRFYLVNENSANPPGVIQFQCSVPVSGAVPIAGDWDGVAASLVAAGVPSQPVSAAGGLSEEELRVIADEAIRRWVARGITAAEASRLAGVKLAVADLPGAELGRAEGGRVTLDRDAAGFGWFVDPTPGEDEEFTPAGSGLRAVDPAAVDRMDLLTAVSHEFGHILGLEDVAEGSVMAGKLPPGLRHLPVDLAFAQWD